MLGSLFNGLEPIAKHTKLNIECYYVWKLASLQRSTDSANKLGCWLAARDCESYMVSGFGFRVSSLQGFGLRAYWVAALWVPAFRVAGCKVDVNNPGS